MKVGYLIHNIRLHGVSLFGVPLLSWTMINVLGIRVISEIKGYPYFTGRKRKSSGNGPCYDRRTWIWRTKVHAGNDG